MRVAFVHPDLGLGGAERLIVDAALALDDLNHECTIFTPFLHPTRTFSEVAPPNPKVNVAVVSVPIPRTIFGRFQAVLAALRCAFVALYVCLFHSFDVAVVDLVSLPILIFSLFRKRTLFYCHYPDKLLAASLQESTTSDGSFLKRAYRTIVDGQDAIAMRCASAVVCNSRFTASMFAHVFPRQARPLVVYPCVDVDNNHLRASNHALIKQLPGNFILSVNRYERKKNVALAIQALSYLRDNSQHEQFKDLHLVIAGGYDARLPENKSCFTHLQNLIADHNLADQVTLLQNVTDVDRMSLLQHARSVLYTPSNEHFGIVPLEAMACSVPVIAVRSGGPCETVVDGVTGVLCEATGSAFESAILKVLTTDGLAERMGIAGRRRVVDYFSRRVLGEELQRVLNINAAVVHYS